MKTAGVVIDAYKLPVFEKHLKDAGYQYEVKSGVTEDTLSLFVKCEWAHKLLPIIQAANNEASRKLS